MFSKLETWLQLRAERRKQAKLRQQIRLFLYDRNSLRQLLLILRSEAGHRWNEESDDSLQAFLIEELEWARVRERDERNRAGAIASSKAYCDYRPTLPVIP